MVAIECCSLDPMNNGFAPEGIVSDDIMHPAKSFSNLCMSTVEPMECLRLSSHRSYNREVPILLTPVPALPERVELLFLELERVYG